ncbi:mitochondrial MPP6 domain-containing protein [Andalucia godoyi]|uniref:Mitochondrial MPP6 domain-containing protein n=1 Tax=Andalucia godoyi TaxID=505711 RepID=A0A8K0F4G8_ANDGO|nr:mitochondrial MPP6 domain-containing protein [Andalucia godoyi]|eukprot:ANDGO_05246.mRNA.1 mitochondrial MPP6 domain-containing protein
MSGKISDRLAKMKFMQRASQSESQSQSRSQESSVASLSRTSATVAEEHWVVEGYSRIVQSAVAPAVSTFDEYPDALFEVLPGRRSFGRKNPAVEKAISRLIAGDTTADDVLPVDADGVEVDDQEMAARWMKSSRKADRSHLDVERSRGQRERPNKKTKR